MTAFEAVWKQRWADAFTPGNAHFSGNLPTLETDDAALRRNYYMGALTMLVLERTWLPGPARFHHERRARRGHSVFLGRLDAIDRLGAAGTGRNEGRTAPLVRAKSTW